MQVKEKQKITIYVQKYVKYGNTKKIMDYCSFFQ